MAEHLSNHHRDTLRKIFAHSSSGNLEWREVLSLLRAVGTVQERHNGKLDVAIGPETEVLTPPHGKDVAEPMLVDLRRMLDRGGAGARRCARGRRISVRATTATRAGASRRSVGYRPVRQRSSAGAQGVSATRSWPLD